MSTRGDATTSYKHARRVQGHAWDMREECNMHARVVQEGIIIEWVPFNLPVFVRMKTLEMARKTLESEWLLNS